MDKHCVMNTYTIMEVIENFQTNHDRVACVVNSAGKLVGVVSQGDIIRAICSGISMYARVEKIIKPSFLYQNTRDMEKAYQIFKEASITLLPIVDDDFNLADVITLSDIYDYMEGGKAD